MGAKSNNSKWTNYILPVTLFLEIATLVCLPLLFFWFLPNQKYKQAQRLKESKEYVLAAEAFKELGTFKDSPDQWILCYRLEGMAQLDAGNYLGAVPYFAGSPEEMSKLRLTLAKAKTLEAGVNHTVGVKSDGTAVAVGNNHYGQCNLKGWTDIIAISAGEFHTVGLRADGTVIAAGNNEAGQCDVESWTDIIAVDAGYNHTVGLKADGTVVSTGDDTFGQCGVYGWRDITAVSAGKDHTVGLKTDGTAVAVGNNESGQCNVRDFGNICSVSSGADYTVLLAFNGEVWATTKKDAANAIQRQLRLVSQTLSISAGDGYALLLQNDGTVYSTNFYGDLTKYYDQCTAAGFSDVITVSAGGQHAVGLKADGTVVTTLISPNSDGNTELMQVAQWTNIKLP